MWENRLDSGMSLCDIVRMYYTVPYAMTVYNEYLKK